MVINWWLIGVLAIFGMLMALALVKNWNDDDDNSGEWGV